MPSACFGAISNVPLLLVQWINTGGTETKNIKNLSPSAKNQSSEIRLSENANKRGPNALCVVEYYNLYLYQIINN